MTRDIVSVEIGRSTWQGPAEEAPRRAASQDDTITMTYRNYRGEVDQRTVLPIYIWFGSTKYHPEPGWLMHAKDLAKGEPRDFALADCQFADLYRSADMAECAAFSAGYEAGERDGRASGQQVRATIYEDAALLAEAQQHEGTGNSYYNDGWYACANAIAETIRQAALTPAPQPEGEAVPKCVACEDSPKHPNIPCAVCGAHPPQPSETGLTVEQVQKAWTAERDRLIEENNRLEMQCFTQGKLISDLQIEIAALRALSGGDHG